MITVFVSSVFRGLEETRKQLLRDLRLAKRYDVTAMEEFAARPHPSIDVCLGELRQSDVMVLVLGPRYGSQLTTGLSYTHEEFREARRLGIPVLAFRVPPDPGLSVVERGGLDGFASEVSSVVTYQPLPSGASLDQLPGLVLAALIGAQERGEIGRRLSVFRKYRKHFEKLLDPTSYFNHAGPLFGRDQEVDRLLQFVSGKSKLQIVVAPGGAGKSRLLLELAVRSEATPDAPKLMFMDGGNPWTTVDVKELPSLPVAVVIDDAHRVGNLDSLVAAIFEHNATCKVLISCRPSALDDVTSQVAALAGSPLPTPMLLDRLEDKVATQFASEELGNAFKHLADDLVRIADRNLLVIKVGARCVVEKLIAPELLSRTPAEFRSLVLDRMLRDPALAGHSDATLRRRLLEVLSAVGPIYVVASEIVKKLADYLGEPEHVIRTCIADMEHAGFLLRRGRRIRVSPDVLADHLLASAAIDRFDKSTGFIDEMMQRFSPELLENIIANAAELDWRVGASDGANSVLNQVWSDIEAQLPNLTHWARSEVLKKLRRAARFAPKQVLRVVEKVVSEREAPSDPRAHALGLDESASFADAAVADMLRFIGGHPDYTLRCVEMLWRLAKDDNRPTNPNPSHPRRLLAELLTYTWDGDWRRPNSPQEQVIDFLIGRLNDAKEPGNLSWAVSTLGSVLKRLGDASHGNRHTYTIGSFVLRPSEPTLASKRRRATECFVSLAMGSRLPEAAAAVRVIAELLQPPRGVAGATLTAEQLREWQPETEEAIRILVRVSREAPAEVIRYIARRELRSVLRKHWPEIGPSLRAGVREATSTSKEALFDLLAGIPWSERFRDYKDEQAHVAELCVNASKEMIKQFPDIRDLVKFVLDSLKTIQTVFEHLSTNVAQVLAEVVSEPNVDGGDLVNALAEEGERGWGALRAVIHRLHKRDPRVAQDAVLKLMDSKKELLQAYSLDSLQGIESDGKTPEWVIELLSASARSGSIVVRRATANTLWRIATEKPVRVKEILVGIEWDDEQSISKAVLRTFHASHGIDPATLTDTEFDALLAKIGKLPSLESGGYEELEFVAYAASRSPKNTVQMLLGRISRKKPKKKAARERWDPIPIGGHGLDLRGWASSTEYPEALRLIRDMSLSIGLTGYYWMPVLFHAGAASTADAIECLREWVNSDDPTKIVEAAHLLSGFDHTFVYASDDFTADLIEAADRNGAKCLKDVRGSLYGIAIGGMYNSTPGKPAPRHVEDKEKARERKEKYRSRPQVLEFYSMLEQHADSEIERARVEWEEEEED